MIKKTMPFAQTFAAVALGWIAILIAISFFRPLMPVDETRYMTVAWEMLVRDAWILPTLNYEPYSHKPPFLFWLIRGSWEVFGVGITPIRIILAFFVLGLFWSTARLAKTLFPDEKTLPERSVLILAALPLFLVYASLIMFDTIMAVWAVCAMLCIWQLSKAPTLKYWSLLGICIGIGILTKGPVMLAYALPAALLGPLWFQRKSWRGWYGGIFLSLLIGASIGLSWAIPAAILGGDAYAEKIFLKQSAGRMVNAFDHEQPFWFYVPVIIAFLAPIFVWPTFWARIRAYNLTLISKPLTGPHNVRFLLCQIIPVIIFFSIISSKQLHYLIPVLPACALLIAALIGQDFRKISLPILLMILPSLILLAEHGFVSLGYAPIDEWTHIIDGFLPWVSLLHIFITLCLCVYAQMKPAQGLGCLATSVFVMLCVTHVQLGQSFFPRYDFSSIREVIAKFPDNPIVIAPKYDGEYGYVLKLRKPAHVFEEHLIDRWLAQHQDSVMIVRVNHDLTYLPLSYYRLYSQPFRHNKRIDILLYKLRPDEKLYWRGTPEFNDEAFMKDKR